MYVQFHTHTRAYIYIYTQFLQIHFLPSLFSNQSTWGQWLAGNAPAQHTISGFPQPAPYVQHALQGERKGAYGWPKPSSI